MENTDIDVENTGIAGIGMQKHGYYKGKHRYWYRKHIG